MQERSETLVRSLGQEDSLEEGMAPHCSVLAWRIPWTGEPGGLQSVGSQRPRYDQSDHRHACSHLSAPWRSPFQAEAQQSWGGAGGGSRAVPEACPPDIFLAWHDGESQLVLHPAISHTPEIPGEMRVLQDANTRKPAAHVNAILPQAP